MSKTRETRSKWILGFIALGMIAVFVGGIVLWSLWPMIVESLVPSGFNGWEIGPFGDSFGPLSSLFSFLSFIIVAFALVLQLEENRRLRVREREDKEEAASIRKQEEERAIGLAKVQREIAEAQRETAIAQKEQATIEKQTAKLAAITARIDGYTAQISDINYQIERTPSQYAQGAQRNDAVRKLERTLDICVNERRTLLLYLDEALAQVGVDKSTPPQ